MKYTTYYVSSNGQPSNGHKTHETLDAALAAWEDGTQCLFQRSGGRSTLEAWEEEEMVGEEEPAASISWLEHGEGGFITASGYWEEEIYRLSCEELEYGGTLAAATLVRRLSSATDSPS